MYTQTQPRKTLICKSTAVYRGVFIMETSDGCTFFVGQKQYDFINLDEATACIDAMLSRVLSTAKNKSSPIA
jgi:hypothetical protein